MFFINHSFSLFYSNIITNNSCEAPTFSHAKQFQKEWNNFMPNNFSFVYIHSTHKNTSSYQLSSRQLHTKHCFLDAPYFHTNINLATKYSHRVDSVIESSLSSKIMHIYLRWNFCEMIINDNKKFLKIWLLSVKIVNYKETLLIFLILRRSHINKVRFQNLYPALYKHSLLFGR